MDHDSHGSLAEFTSGFGTAPHRQYVPVDAVQLAPIAMLELNAISRLKAGIDAENEPNRVQSARGFSASPTSELTRRRLVPARELTSQRDPYNRSTATVSVHITL